MYKNQHLISNGSYEKNNVTRNNVHSIYYQNSNNSHYDDRRKDKALVTQYNMKEFLKMVFATLHPTKKMISNWHLDLLIEYLKAVENGGMKRLIVNLPPRSLKSVCINVAWPAWLLGKDPSTRIITVSYSQSLSEKHAVDCRLVMQSDWYKEMFPETRIARGMNMKSKFVTTEHGFRFATSTGGTLTGEGADIIIIDDPCSAVDTFSRRKRNKAYEWFRQCLLSRLNDCVNGKIVLVMQRLHVDDLTGMLLKNDHDNNWHHLKVSAIATKNQHISFGEFSYNRLAGEQLYDNAEIIYDGVDVKEGVYAEKMVYSANDDEVNHAISSPFKLYCWDNDTAYNTTNAIVSVSYEVLFMFTCTQELKVVHEQEMLFNDDSLTDEVLRKYCSAISSVMHNIIFDDINSRISATGIMQVIAMQSIQHHYTEKSLSYAKDIVLHKQHKRKKVCFHKEVQKNVACGINLDFSTIKREVGTTTFNIQYQQEPTLSQHTIIKEGWLIYSENKGVELPSIEFLKRCKIGDARDCAINKLRDNISLHVKNFEYIYQSWDCAIKSGDNNDYSVCTSWGVKDGKYHLIHVMREKLDYPELRVIVMAMAAIFQPSAILIEDCAAGQQILQEIQHLSTVIAVFPIRPQYDKVTRFTLVSPVFERQLVVLPKSASWKNAFTEEILHFPNVEYDDQVDSTSQFLSWSQQNEIKMLRLNNDVFRIRNI